MNRTDLEARVNTFQDARDSIAAFYNVSKDATARAEANRLRNWLEGMIVQERRNQTDEPGWVEKGFSWLHEKMGDARGKASLFSPGDTLPAPVKANVIRLVVDQSSKSAEVDKAWDTGISKGTKKPDESHTVRNVLIAVVVVAVAAVAYKGIGFASLVKKAA